MIEITNINTSSKQRLLLEGANREIITLDLEYRPTQESWYFSLQYQDFVLNNKKIVNSPNLLRQYKNILPFGLNCVVLDGTDPYFIYDFENRRCVLNLLDKDEVELIESELF